MITTHKFWSTAFRTLVATACSIALLPGDVVAYGSSTRAAQEPPTQGQATRLPPDQLDSLVAPIALYPDTLLAQVLVASTYPLELYQLQQWLAKNPGLKDQALADAVAKQPWDPSIQALAGLPDVVKRLADDIQWTTDLGNAFLAQQSEVMDAVQRMRKKAEDRGNLKSTEQQKVETRVVESKSVIVIEQSNPEVLYVPAYDPMVVWGAPIYPYPYYPYYPGYYAAGLAISFGVGLALGAWWGGGWGCGWGNNNITINNNNNFNRNSNIGGGNRPSQLPSRGGELGGPGGRRGEGNWKHNPQHRGGAPYRDRATADRFGGTTRGDSLANRQSSARQQLSRQGGRVSQPSVGAGLGGARGPGASTRPSGGISSGNRSSSRGPNSIGGRDLSRSGGGNRDAFGGGSRGSRSYSGSSARSSASRGASSMGSRGGGARGGGGRRR